MKIKQILSKACVVSQIQAATKEGVIDELATLLSQNTPVITREETFQVLMEREKLGSTGIGNGVAIPHGKLAQLTEIVAGFGRSSEGIAFDSQDGKPAKLFFILLAPENAASLHLKALARISRLLKDIHFRNRLMEAANQEEIYNVIVEEDEKL